MDEKLRRPKSFAGTVYVFVQANRFREDQSQCSAGYVMTLLEPTDDTTALIRYTVRVLEHIYKARFIYKKCGMMLMDLSEATQQQTSLFQSTLDHRTALKCKL
jgi:DNA polymerase V